MPFIILDRDGVINYDSDDYIKSPAEWRPIPGSLEAIAHLNRAGFRVLIATNQSGVARGFYDLETLSAIHEKLLQQLTAVGGYVEEIFYCPHHPTDGCVCRKPQPGLIEQMQKKYAIHLASTYLIGDSITDVQVAKQTGCQPILVLSGKGERMLKQHPELATTLCFDNLASAAEYIVKQQG